MSVVAIPEPFAIQVAGQCDRGKVRKANEDMALHTSTPLGELLIVAEGVDGAEASKLAVDAILSCVEGVPEFFPPEIAVEEAIRHANAVIAAAATDPGSPNSQMHATAVVALLRRNTKRSQAPVQAIIGQVGDSRAYLVHNQKLTHLTGDHSTAPDLSDQNQIMLQEADAHPDESMTPWRLGQEFSVRVEMREISLEDGDSLVLCSDGLWSCVPEQKIELVLADRAHSVEQASRALLNLALDAGGRDNVAIEIARFTQSGDSPAATPGVVEAPSERRPEIEPVGEFEHASDASQSDEPIAPLNVELPEFLTATSSPKRKNVLDLIRNLGKRTSNNGRYSPLSLLGHVDENGAVEESIAAEPAEPDRPSTEATVDEEIANDPAPPAEDAHLERVATVEEKVATAELSTPPVSGVQPIVSWAPPEPISYGTRLSSVQLNATTSIEGKYVYTPGPGYVLPAGTHTLWVTFHAADSPEDTSVLSSVSITVSKATPAIQWPAPSNVAPGVPLGAAQLNASSSVPGTFEYSPAAGEMLTEGTHTLSATFIPADQANYTTAQATASIKVARTVPIIDWTSPDSIPCGAPLGPAQLNASASVPGTFAYSPAAGEILSAGSHTLSVTFTPSDRTEYDSTVATVPLTVTRGTPVITWVAPEKITYGVALSDQQLNATASLPGTFVYKPGQGAVLVAGEHTPSLVFTPENLSDYSPAEAAVRLTVDKANPVISWSAPEPINDVTPLGPAQLNASASVPGTFAYNPAAGEQLKPGAHTLSVIFTPADNLNYTQAQATVSLTVAAIVNPEITWRNPAPVSYGTALGEEQLCAISSAPGSFLYIPAAGNVLPPGEHRLSVTFTPDDRDKYAEIQTAVTLIVQGLPNIAALLESATQTASASGAPDRSVTAGATETQVVTEGEQITPGVVRETHTYKGIIYEKGDDGQWHRQQK